MIDFSARSGPMLDSDREQLLIRAELLPKIWQKLQCLGLHGHQAFLNRIDRIGPASGPDNDLKTFYIEASKEMLTSRYLYWGLSDRKSRGSFYLSEYIDKTECAMQSKNWPELNIFADSSKNFLHPNLFLFYNAIFLPADNAIRIQREKIIEDFSIIREKDVEDFFERRFPEVDTKRWSAFESTTLSLMSKLGFQRFTSLESRVLLEFKIGVRNSGLFLCVALSAKSLRRRQDFQIETYISDKYTKIISFIDPTSLLPGFTQYVKYLNTSKDCMFLIVLLATLFSEFSSI